MGHRNYRGRSAHLSRRKLRDPNRSGKYRLLIMHHFGTEDKKDMGWNEYLVVSNSGRFVKHWEYINVHHRGRDIDKARVIMKRLSGEWT